MDNIRIKEFSIFKVGYTAGVYGCSGEYYKVIVTYKNIDLDLEKELHYVIEAMYTNGKYIRKLLKDNGYIEKGIAIPYTQLKRKDLKGWEILRENDVIEDLKKELHLIEKIDL
jgi:hypothetical protein